ncbi:hypothetical protein DN388_12270 [Pseudomonas sp. S12(2018)]|nr:hypothetical protein [Pseudomonas sp. S12(2018)]
MVSVSRRICHVCVSEPRDTYCSVCDDAIAQPAAQHQSEPVALPERKSYEESFSVHGQGQIMGWNAYHDEVAKLGPLYTHADAGEVERLLCIREVENRDLAKGNHTLRAQLGEAHALLRRCLLAVREQHCDEGEADFDLPVPLLSDIDAALSAQGCPADAGEAEQGYHNSVVEGLVNRQNELREERDTLRAQLANWQALAAERLEMITRRDALLGRARSFVAFVHKCCRKNKEYAPLHWQEMVELDRDLSASTEPIPFPGYPPVPEDRKLPAEPSAPVERDELEAEAQRIYESWSDQRGYVPWVARGNSLKQDEARRQARAALERKP